MHTPYSVVIIRTGQILATGLTLGAAKAESRRWNRRSPVDDCSTWQPAPAGVTCHPREPATIEETELDRD
jgi:hypothetical protein